jgi:hypothetical protein
MVISTCGWLGTGLPTLRMRAPPANCGPAEQECGDELAGCRGIELDGAARYPALAVHGEGQAGRRGGSIIPGHLNPEGGQRSQDGAHRPGPRARIPVEAHRCVA